MTVTTDEYWTVDGVVLNTLAFNIRTLGGSRSGVPSLRGGNVTVPYRPGDMWVPKMPASRTLTLSMWVKGADRHGYVPPNFRAQFNNNWRMLKDLFWRTDRQIEIAKRVRFVDGSILTAYALAEFGGGLEPEMFSPGMASFSVDLILADPFFYGNLQGYDLPPRPPDPSRGDPDAPPVEETLESPAEGVINNPGDDVARFMTLEFNGGANYVLVNKSVNKPDGLRLSLEGVEGRVLLDTEAFRAVAGGTPVLDKIKVTGPRGVPYWFLLARGDNELRLEGGGRVTISFRAPYT